MCRCPPNSCHSQRAAVPQPCDCGLHPAQGAGLPWAVLGLGMHQGLRTSSCHQGRRPLGAGRVRMVHGFLTPWPPRAAGSSLAPPPRGTSLVPEGSGRPCPGCCCMSSAVQKTMQSAEFICTLQQRGTREPASAPHHYTITHEALPGSPQRLLRLNLIIIPWGSRGQELVLQ